MDVHDKHSAIGRAVRLGQLFRADGYAVCVAADHGFMSVPSSNVYRLRSILWTVIEAGIDGILLSPGQAVRMGELFNTDRKPSMIVRCDWVNASRLPIVTEQSIVPTGSLRRTVVIRPRDARRLGATAILTYLILGYDREFEAANISSISHLARESHAVGLPLGVEPLAFGTKAVGSRIPELLERGVALALQYGADFLKVPYSGTIESFERIVKAGKGVPVLVLGGSRSLRTKDALDMARDAKQVGARGVLFGRNVTQAEDPGAMVRSLCELFHESKQRPALKPTKARQVLVDPRLCTGCGLCMLACNAEKTEDQGVAASRLQVDASSSAPARIHFCTECSLCVESCEVGALSLSKDGGVRLRPEKCTRCGACITVCPEGIIKNGDDVTPVFICDLCLGAPACVAACPTGALSPKEEECE